MGILVPLDISALSWIGAIVLLAGECCALFYSRNIVKALAASTIAEAGYLIMGIAQDSLVGETGAIMHLVIQVFMRGLVLVTAWRLVRNAGTSDTSGMKGSFRTMPLTTVLFGFGLFSVMGLSPFKGSFSRFLVLYGALDKGMYLLAAVGTLASVVAAVYYIRIFQQICMEEPVSGRHPEKSSEPGGVSFVLMFVLTGITILLGLFPEPLLHFSYGMAGFFLPGAPQDLFPEFETPWSWIVLIPYVGGFVIWGVS
jgi:NADH:ubiquinone oxidoreductase subunit 2 (subunit N)